MTVSVWSLRMFVIVAFGPGRCCRAGPPFPCLFERTLCVYTSTPQCTWLPIAGARGTEPTRPFDTTWCNRRESRTRPLSSSPQGVAASGQHAPSVQCRHQTLLRAVRHDAGRVGAQVQAQPHAARRESRRSRGRTADMPSSAAMVLSTGRPVSSRWSVTVRPTRKRPRPPVQSRAGSF